MNWEINSDSHALPKPEVGDKVLLMFTDMDKYSARVLVQQVNKDSYSGTIETVFLRDKGELSSSIHINLKGKQATFKPVQIHAVFKKQKINF